MINILFIVPYGELDSIVKNVCEHHPDKDKIQEHIVLETVETVHQIEFSKYDVIVARGYTAIRLKELCYDIPVIEIPVTGYDVIRALNECCCLYHPDRVAFIGADKASCSVKDFEALFHFRIQTYINDNYTNIDKIIDSAVQDECEVVIGGYSASRIAQKRGIKSIYISTGEEAIYQTIDEAVRAVEMLRRERVRTEAQNVIVQTSREGIIYIDCNGKILTYNKAAQSILKADPVYEKNIYEAAPFMEEDIRLVMKSSKTLYGILYKIMKTTISVDYTPVIVKETITGIVITFQDITHIQQLESQIRQKLSRKGLRAKYHFEDIIHQSDIMENTISTARKYAKSYSNVLLVGESGTGKELFAQSIHNASERASGPFVAVNCAALSENLLESELFGYTEGAFTGSIKGGKAGLFELAHNGTIFLDEISEISASLQSKLLRVIQEREIRRIGSDKVVSVNVRIIAATNKNLDKLVTVGTFRQDLFYRINVLKLFIPPLRSRGEDVKIIFLHLLQVYSRKNEKAVPLVTEETSKLLLDYPFKGNVRELNNIVERIVTLNEGDIITDSNLRKALYISDIDETNPVDRSISQAADQDEQRLIYDALAACNGNQTRAAKMLGISRTTLWRKMNR